MASFLFSKEIAQDILKRYIRDSNVLRHCHATRDKALVIAQLLSKTRELDIELISVSALLHDIGRAKVHDITHGYIGGQILQTEGFPQSVIKIVERHVLGGFSADEAQQIGLPRRSFLPQTWEEKIVCVADKLGHYAWDQISQPMKWISKLRERLTRLKGRYGNEVPYITSMHRAKVYCETLVEAALQRNSGVKAPKSLIALWDE